MKASHAVVAAAAKAAAATAIAAVAVAASAATENVKAENAASLAKVKPKCVVKRKSGSRAKRVRYANHGNRAKAAGPARANVVAAADAATRKCARTTPEPWRALR